MKSKQLNEKYSAFIAFQEKTKTVELTSSELTNVDGGCNHCDKNGDGRVSWIENFLCHFRPAPIPKPFPFPRPIHGPY